jgi:putative mRNA 3-end processing factor
MVTHGSVAVLVRHLCEQGLDAMPFETEYGDDEEEVPMAAPEPAAVLP